MNEQFRELIDLYDIRKDSEVQQLESLIQRVLKSLRQINERPRFE